MSRKEKRAEVERWRSSGLSQSAYCRERERERGLGLAQFSYWKRRFAVPAATDTATLVPVHLVDERGAQSLSVKVDVA